MLKEISTWKYIRKKKLNKGFVRITSNFMNENNETVVVDKNKLQSLKKIACCYAQ